MKPFLDLSKYSIGVGDRFSHQAEAQLQACELAGKHGKTIVPVWNKSNREHIIIGSEPSTTRAAADAAVKARRWPNPYHVDADHIRCETVDRFLASSDFFTIDVADWIGRNPLDADIDGFISKHPELTGTIDVPGLPKPMVLTRPDLQRISAQYLTALQEAGRIYRHISDRKESQTFITEVSMDETEKPQDPSELLVILAGLADQEIPLQTIAPKFTGRFNKGVDYQGDLEKFGQEFNADLAVIAFATKSYGLPRSLKLSVHSGSDKFSIYRVIREALARFEAGLHLKTAGTTWLEELAALAEAGGEGLAIARDIYTAAIAHRDELCAPYATVIDIDANKLPSTAAVKEWDGAKFAAVLRHEQNNPEFNPNVRQLLHVGYKVAAQMGQRFLDALNCNREAIAKQVTYNLFHRHIKPVFLGN